MHVYKFTNMNLFFKYVRFTCSANSVVHVVDCCWSLGGLFVDVVILGDGVGLGYLIRDLQWANKSCFYIVESS